MTKVQIVKRILLSALLFFIIIGGVYRWNSVDEYEEQIWEFNGTTMGSTYSVKISHSQKVPIQLIRTEVEAFLQEFDKELSTYREDSVISHINSTVATDTTEISETFYDLVKASTEIWEQTQGAFDPAAGYLYEQWGFGSHQQLTKLPTQEQVAQFLLTVGMDQIKVEQNADGNAYLLSKSHDKTQLNFNSVAPGQAADIISRMLRNRGYHNHLVDVGGEIYASGMKSIEQDLPWVVGIERPTSQRDDERKVIDQVVLTDKCLATSGNYRNYYEKLGKRYAHTLDPRTGFPVSHNLASATIVAPSCLQADAFATAVMVFGAAQGLDFIEKMGLYGYLIVAVGNEEFRTMETKNWPTLRAAFNKEPTSETPNNVTPDKGE